jgi:hypothetical protein
MVSEHSSRGPSALTEKKPLSAKMVSPAGHFYGAGCASGAWKSDLGAAAVPHDLDAQAEQDESGQTVLDISV